LFDEFEMKIYEQGMGAQRGSKIGRPETAWSAGCTRIGLFDTGQ
jgi:hypothetical protein